MIQAVICAGLAYHSAKRSRQKKAMHRDAYYDQEKSRFSPAHLIDLFGADGKKFSAEEIREGKRQGSVRFTEELTEKIFRGLDYNGDKKISQVCFHFHLKRLKNLSTEARGAFV